MKFLLKITRIFLRLWLKLQRSKSSTFYLCDAVAASAEFFSCNRSGKEYFKGF